MAAEDFGSTTPKFAGVSGAWTVIGGCYTGTPGTDAALSTMGLVVDGVPGGAPGHGQHPGNGGAPAPSAPAPVIEAVLAETAAKKQTWVFDELSGGFFGDGTKHSLGGINDLKFDLARSDGVASQDDNGSDWVILK